MHTLFYWLYQNVLGNLIADVIWGVPLWTIGYLKLKQQHEKHHQQLKNHIDYQFSKLAEEKIE